MPGKPMNSWQEVIHRIVFEQQLVQPGRIAFRLHAHSDYLSDICRRERVNPMAVCNAILQEAAQDAETDLPKYLQITMPILGLLLNGTGLMAQRVDPKLRDGLTYNKLCEFTGILCKTLGTTIESLAKVEADGEYDEDDDPEIAKCQDQIGLLVQRLQALSCELARRRAVKGARS